MDGLKLYGEYTLESVDENGVIIQREVYKNLITNNLYLSFLKYLNYSADTPAANDINVNYLAVGTGTSSPAVTDTQLQTEYFRKATATKIRGTRDFTAILTLGPTEANTTIRELGVFAKGTGTANSGTLLSRVSINKVKNSNISLNVYWKLTLS